MLYPMECEELNEDTKRDTELIVDNNSTTRETKQTSNPNGNEEDKKTNGIVIDFVWPRESCE